MKRGEWNKQGGWQLSEKTVGIIGVGHVGKDLVSLLQPFHCTILVNDILPQKEYYSAYNLIEVSKDDLFAQSDIVTLHVPLTNETRHLINERTLELMQSNTYLINTSRGAVVNQNHLKAALLSGRIAGAALDVYEVEPPIDYEFLEMRNLICTPHIGGSAYEGVMAMGRSAIGHLRAYFNAGR